MHEEHGHGIKEFRLRHSRPAPVEQPTHRIPTQREKGKHMDSLFSTNNTDTVRSSRIIYTPSVFARSSLLHLQETGTLQALHPHKSERIGLHSCLFFTSFPVREGWSMEASSMNFGPETVCSSTAESPTAMKRECRTVVSLFPPASGPCSGAIFTARI